jgi:hypothetical protein
MTGLADFIKPGTDTRRKWYVANLHYLSDGVTIAGEVCDSLFFSDRWLFYSDDHTTYGWPERIPKYIKRMIWHEALRFRKEHTVPLHECPICRAEVLFYEAAYSYLTACDVYVHNSCYDKLVDELGGEYLAEVRIAELKEWIVRFNR